MPVNDPWKYVRVDKAKIEDNPYFKVGSTPSPRPPSATPATNLTGEYEVTNYYNTYALGVEDLRCIPLSQDYKQPIFTKTDGSKIYRPLTTLESLEVMVKDFNTLKDANGAVRTLDDRKILFKNYKFTCTGVAYKKIKPKKNVEEFKIIPECPDLILIQTDYGGSSLPIDYSSINGTKLRFEDAKYNQLLSQQEVLEHPAWIASVGDTNHGRNVLKSYSEIVFDLLKSPTNNGPQAMGYWLNTAPDSDQLRALVVRSIDISSSAGGDVNLDGSARFLRVARAKKI